MTLFIPLSLTWLPCQSKAEEGYKYADVSACSRVVGRCFAEGRNGSQKISPGISFMIQTVNADVCSCTLRYVCSFKFTVVFTDLR